MYTEGKQTARVDDFKGSKETVLSGIYNTMMNELDICSMKISDIHERTNNLHYENLPGVKDNKTEPMKEPNTYAEKFEVVINRISRMKDELIEINNKLNTIV